METASSKPPRANISPPQLYKLPLGDFDRQRTVADLLAAINLSRNIQGGAPPIVGLKVHPPDELLDVRLQDTRFRLSSLPQSQLQLELVEPNPAYQITSTSKVDGSHFRIVRQVGEGAFSSVYLVEAKFDRRLFAMKSINRYNCRELGEWECLLAELDILKRLRSHQYVVRLYFSFEDQLSLNLVMDYHPAGDFFSLLKRSPLGSVGEVKVCLVQVVHALKAVHNIGYVYRDLKPENILVAEDGTLKLADFGFARKLHHGKVSGICGSYEYMAPEMLAMQEYDQSYDVYSLGILLFEMLVGKTPFHGATRSNIAQLVSQGIVLHPGLNPIEGDLIRKLTERDPAQRLGSSDILLVLDHPWFSDLETCKPLVGTLLEVPSEQTEREWRQPFETPSETAGLSYNYLSPLFEVTAKKIGPKLSAAQTTAKSQ